MSAGKHLRGYQCEAVDSVFKAWETADITMLDMATGTGKTIIVDEIFRRAVLEDALGLGRRIRCLLLADRRDLIFQGKHKIEKNSGLSVEIEMGEHRARRDLFHDCDVMISSFQSQTPGRRSKPTDFDIVVVDECHSCNAANKSWIEPIAHYRQNPHCKVLGVTATPDAECLKYFKNVCYHYLILSGIKEGYLVNIEQKVAHIKSLDFSHIRTTCGDLNATDLARVMEDEKPLQSIVQSTLEVMFGVPQHSLSNLPIEQWSAFLFMNGRPKVNLIFCASVAHAKMMSDILNRVHPGLSDWVCSDKKLVSEVKREEIRQAFATGKLLAVANVGIYSKGFDNPLIEMVTMARPTKSEKLYKQSIGRGTRTLEGIIDGIMEIPERLAAIASSKKKILTVLDLAGNSGRHDLVTSIDILAENVSRDAKVRAREKAKKSAKPRNVMELLKESQGELEAEKTKREEARRKSEAIEAERKKHLVAKSTYSLTDVSPFEKHGIKHESPTWWDKKHGHPLSDAQRNILRQHVGVDPDSISLRCARKLIGAHFNGPPTPRQMSYLKWKRQDTIGLTKRTASALIDKLKANEGPPKIYASYDQPPIEHYDDVPV